MITVGMIQGSSSFGFLATLNGYFKLGLWNWESTICHRNLGFGLDLRKEESGIEIGEWDKQAKIAR